MRQNWLSAAPLKHWCSCCHSQVDTATQHTLPLSMPWSGCAWALLSVQLSLRMLDSCQLCCTASAAIVLPHRGTAAQLLEYALIACPHLGAGVIAAGGDSQLRRLLGSSDGYVRQWAADALAVLTKPDLQQQPEAIEGEPAVAAASAASGASAQPTRPPRVCAAPGCGATSGLKRCGGCGSVRYCSAECSRVHWLEHRAECRRLQAERAAAASRSTPE